MAEEALSPARRVIQVVGRAVHVTMKGYVGTKRDLKSDLPVVCWAAEVTTEKFPARESSLSELDFNVQQLAWQPGVSTIYRDV